MEKREATDLRLAYQEQTRWTVCEWKTGGKVPPGPSGKCVFFFLWPRCVLASDCLHFTAGFVTTEPKNTPQLFFYDSVSGEHLIPFYPQIFRSMLYSAATFPQKEKSVVCLKLPQGGKSQSLQSQVWTKQWSEWKGYGSVELSVFFQGADTLDLLTDTKTTDSLNVCM